MTMTSASAPLVPVPIPIITRRRAGAAATTTSSSSATTATTTGMMIITSTPHRIHSSSVAPRVRVPDTRVVCRHPVVASRGAVIRCARAVVVVGLVLVLVIVAMVMDGAVDAEREEDEDDEGDEEEGGEDGGRRGEHIEYFYPTSSFLFGTVAVYLLPEGKHRTVKIVTKQTVWW